MYMSFGQNHHYKISITTKCDRQNGAHLLAGQDSTTERALKVYEGIYAMWIIHYLPCNPHVVVSNIRCDGYMDTHFVVWFFLFGPIFL